MSGRAPSAERSSVRRVFAVPNYRRFVAGQSVSLVGSWAETIHDGVLAAVLVGAASIAFLTTGNSTIQLNAPPQMRGRVTGLWTTLFVGSTPIGAVLIGVIAHSFGGRSALGAGIAGCLLAVVAGLLVLRVGGYDANTLWTAGATRATSVSVSTFARIGTPTIRRLRTIPTSIDDASPARRAAS
jgi:MFS family permease